MQPEFVPSARTALASLQQRPYDFVFADLDLPDIDGIELFRTVETNHPDIVRVMVADQRELGALRSSRVAHRYMSRPWDIDSIIEVVRRRYELESALADRGLEQLLARTDRLPPAPSAYIRIADEMRSPDPSLERVAGIVSQDPALTAKVLQHVNSAYFALRSEITTVERAVTMLGMNSIMAIVMSIGLYGGNSSAPASVVEKIRSQASAVAGLSRMVARMEGASAADRDNAFLAGMLHDCGKLIMTTNWPHIYADMVDSDDLAQERQVIGADHSLVGAYLLASWKLADPVVEAVAHHHAPSAGSYDELGPAGIVHIAHALAHRPGNGTLPAVDLEFMGKLDLWDRAAMWIAGAEDLEYQAANR